MTFFARKVLRMVASDLTKWWATIPILIRRNEYNDDVYEEMICVLLARDGELRDPRKIRLDLWSDGPRWFVSVGLVETSPLSRPIVQLEVSAGASPEEIAGAFAVAIRSTWAALDEDEASDSDDEEKYAAMAARSENKIRERLLGTFRSLRPETMAGNIAVPCHIVAEIHNASYFRLSDGFLSMYRCDGYWWGLWLPLDLFDREREQFDLLTPIDMINMSVSMPDNFGELRPPEVLAREIAILASA